MLKQLREIGIADRNQLIGNLHPFMLDILDIIDVADGNDIRAMNPAKITIIQYLLKALQADLRQDRLPLGGVYSDIIAKALQIEDILLG